MGNLTIWDLILTPLYLLILIALARRNRDKKYPIGHPLREYYLKGLYAKFGGAIFIALIFEYYYRGGDTYNFFYHSKIINSSLSDSFSTWFKLMMHSSSDDDPKLYSYISQMFWYEDIAAYNVSKVCAIIGLVNGNTYIPIALIFAFLSYSGTWAMYTTFVSIYPKLTRNLAFAFLFIPSTFVWGSAVFKDTLCMFGLGWMVYATFRIFINREFSVKNFIILAASFYLIAQIKLYILVAFIPALNLWLLLTYSRKIQSSGLRWIVNLLFVGATVFAFYLFAGKFAKELNKYSLESVAATSKITRDWTTYAAGLEGGSVYDLGEIDGTAAGTLSKFPQAVVVTLFRPFPWEVRKVIVLLSAIESFLFIFFTLKVFFNRSSKPFRTLGKDPNLIFFLTFTLIFAFAVGISSGNFGALSRYKIPCLPFFGAMLVVLLSKQKEIKDQRKTSLETANMERIVRKLEVKFNI